MVDEGSSTVLSDWPLRPWLLAGLFGCAGLLIWLATHGHDDVPWRIAVAAFLFFASIAAAFGLPAATLSFHLKELRGAGLITGRRAGRSLIYAADYAAMRELVGYLTENCCRSRSGAPAAAARLEESEA